MRQHLQIKEIETLVSANNSVTLIVNFYTQIFCLAHIL
jgi:hypothetical protein